MLGWASHCSATGVCTVCICWVPVWSIAYLNQEGRGQRAVLAHAGALRAAVGYGGIVGACRDGQGCNRAVRPCSSQVECRGVGVPKCRGDCIANLPQACTKQ